MKKKFLSLMMAAAVVATTSVSAFAANVTDSDKSEAEADVTITGNVQDDSGQDAAGTFKVTVPTTANFTVTKKGVFLGTELEISNEGSQNIDVYAYQFVDESSSDKINVIEEDQLKERKDSEKRTTVSMKLTSGGKVAHLKTDNTGGGVSGDNFEPGLGIKLLNLTSGTELAPKKGKIKLEGKAGQAGQAGDAEQGAIREAVSDDFTLTLKIKKAAN